MSWLVATNQSILLPFYMSIILINKNLGDIVTNVTAFLSPKLYFLVKY